MSKRYEWHQKEVNELLKILKDAKTTKEVEEVFRNFLTPREINDMARRWKAFNLLKAGKSYSDVTQETGMSPVTISRVSARLGFGFREALKDISKKKTAKPRDLYMKKTLKYKGVPIMKIKK